jgi:hypothetical protein
VRPSIRVPVHRPFPASGNPEPAEEDESTFLNRPCFVFNRSLPAAYDDKHCSHCQHYLTPRCPHIDEFIEDVEELGPE